LNQQPATSSPWDPRRPTANGLWLDQPPFINSHRARCVCTRELARVLAEVARHVKLLDCDDAADVPVVRRSPERYSVQLGPVALTIAWLRSALDRVSEGELLVILWRGTIAPGRAPQPERILAAPITMATILREDVVTVAAENETSWRWYPPDVDRAGLTSDELAKRIVDRLRHAHADSRGAVAAAS
jgi:hypothetical protein